jgi:serine/threonine protein kinase
LTDWRPLARGGLAVVWQARQRALDRLVAVKVYERELEQGHVGRFLSEAAAAGRVSDHPGIVTAYDAGVLPDDRPYLVMELCPGGSLSRWLKSENRPNEEQVRQIGVRIADALAAVHACGVLHRDVKPANILIDSYGHPRLADFGLAAVAGVEARTTKVLRVTPAYAPPEVFRTQQAAEPGDVFSLAATLYALLAGGPPRPTVGPSATLEQMLEAISSPIPPLPDVNWFLMDPLMTALSDDPGERPTAARFHDQLAEAAAPRPLRRGPHGGTGQAPTSHGRAGRPLGSARPAVSSTGQIAVAKETAPRQAPRPPLPAGASPSRRKRRVASLALSAALVVVVAQVTAWLISEPVSSGVPALRQTATTEPAPSSADSSRAFEPSPPSSTAADADGNTAARSARKRIELKGSPGSAKPFQTVRIDGTYRGGAGTFLRVQRWEAGSWLAFPLPAKTDESGQFTAYAELGQPGRYRLRLLDPNTGVNSEPFSLVIRG